MNTLWQTEPDMLRPATMDDIDTLVALENRCFTSDRLSRRNFRYLLTKGNTSLIVDVTDGRLRGYVLVLYSQGTSAARLYSIAIDPECRRQGVGSELIRAAEAAAIASGYVSMRLEIRRDNPASQTLFQHHGYKQFKQILDYYEDHMDALRYQKSLGPHLHPALFKVPYYQQTTDFTCGPAALMMAMKALSSDLELDRKLELRIWREATTIFMLSGHGGCSPYGLALSAFQRGFDLELYVNENAVFLIDSVRSPEKKEVMRLVQEDMIQELSQLPIALHYGSLDVDAVQEKFEAGGIPVVLISSYRIYGERFPHWVVVTGFDPRYVYVHDPLIDHEAGETLTDSVDMPIPRREFQRMARYGKAGQKAVLILYHSNTSTPVA